MFWCGTGICLLGIAEIGHAVVLMVGLINFGPLRPVSSLSIGGLLMLVGIYIAALSTVRWPDDALWDRLRRP